jgi:predicted transcriptional regulator
MVITTASLDPETYRRLKHLAVDDGVAVRELIRRAVAEYVKRRTRRKP